MYAGVSNLEDDTADWAFSAACKKTADIQGLSLPIRRFGYQDAAASGRRGLFLVLWLSGRGLLVSRRGGLVLSRGLLVSRRSRLLGCRGRRLLLGRLLPLAGSHER